MKHKISDVFFYEENNIIENLREKNKKLSSSRAHTLAATIMTSLFGVATLSGFLFTDVGINNYFFVLSLLVESLSAVGVIQCLDLNKKIKINNKSIEKFEKELKRKKHNLNKKINVFEKKKSHKERTLEISKDIELANLKRKKLIIQDYIIYKEKYEYYYRSGVLQAHLSKKYTKEEYEFIELLITTNIAYNESLVNTNTNKKNKTKIK